MKSFLLNALAGCLLFCLPIFATAQSAYEKGWTAFNENNREEAESQFKSATENAESAPDAWLSLALLYYSMDKEAESHDAFLKFLTVSKNPYPYVYSLWSTDIGFGGSSKLSKLDLAAFKKIFADKELPGTIRAMMNQRMGDHWENSNQFKKSWPEYDKLGAISNWQVVGTFDNTSGSGFNKSWGPLENSGANASFKNKVEADVKWYNTPVEKKNRWFDFNNYFNIGNSIMYAQTFLKSETSQQGYIFSGVSGSIKIWVNDKLITNVLEERNCDLDSYINGVELNKGYNRILVQIGESEADAANFMIRICDEKGNPLLGLTSTQENQDYDKAENYTSTEKRIFAEAYFEDYMKDNPKDILHQILLANCYLRNDKKLESRKAMKLASSLAPKNTMVSIFAISAFSRDNNVTDLTKEREKIKKTDPKSILVLKMLSNESAEREDFDEKERLLAEIKNLYGESFYTELEDMAAFARNQKNDEFMSSLNALYKKYPNNEVIVLLYYQIKNGAEKNPGNNIKILQKYLKTNHSTSVENTYISSLFQSGAGTLGLTMLKKQIDNQPHTIGNIGQLADIYYNFQDYATAKSYAERAYAFAPYVGSYSQKLGEIAEAQGENSEAEKLYERAIYYTPTLYDARTQLRKLQDKEELFEKFEKHDAEKIFKESPPITDFPDDHSNILLYDNQRIVYPEGASEEKVEILIKVHNQAGIDNWKEYHVAYNGNSQDLIFDKTEVFKKDGSISEAERSDNYAVFTDLEAGDAIHISYRLRNYNSGKLAKHFWDQFSFQYFYPAQLTRYSILAPKDYKFQFEMMNGDIQPVVTDDENMKMYTWEAKNQKSLKSENAMPPLIDIAPTLDISTLPDWKFVANWYNDLSTSRARQDFEIKETVAELFKDAPANMTELEKARIIYNHIEQNVSYSQVPFRQGPIIPQKASRTLRTKLGDCKDVSTLFVSMCKEVGIKANLLLVDTKDNGRKHLNLPTIAFNHCIARAICDGKPIYVELTNQKLSFGSLPDMDVNARVLLIPNDMDSTFEGLTTLNPKNRPMNGLDRITELTVENSDLLVARKTIRSGDMASSTRSNYADIGREEQEKDMTRAIASGHTNQVKLMGLSFGNLQGREDTIHYNYKYRVTNEVNDVVGMKIFRLPWADKLETLDFIALEKRNYPFVMYEEFGAENEKEVLTFTVPTGKVLAEVPKNAKYSCAVADYSITYVKQGNKLVATREFKIKKEYMEVSEYNEFKEFFNKVMEADTKQIALK
ncbi:MAG: DUF3857 domain-containing protein [Flavobacteriales bacterium]